MTTQPTERLYPSIPEATEEDAKLSMSAVYADNCTCPQCRVIRIAAHHARRAAELELRLAEIKLAVAPLVCAFNDTDSSRRRVARVEQQLLDRAIEAIMASIKDEP